jgi:hypothetical protein
VVAAVVRVKSFANYAVIFYEDCADDRIRVREGNASTGESERAKYRGVTYTWRYRSGGLRG